jgi:hypothetical protein
MYLLSCGLWRQLQRYNYNYNCFVTPVFNIAPVLLVFEDNVEDSDSDEAVVADATSHKRQERRWMFYSIVEQQ